MGYTTLYWAVELQHTGIAHMLLEYDANQEPVGAYDPILNFSHADECEPEQNSVETTQHTASHIPAQATTSIVGQRIASSQYGIRLPRDKTFRNNLRNNMKYHAPSNATHTKLQSVLKISAVLGGECAARMLSSLQN